MTASQAVLSIDHSSRPVSEDAAFLLKGKEVSKKHLINALNHINFKEKTVTLVLQGTPEESPIHIEAFPMPVLSDYPTFRFLKPLPEAFRTTEVTRIIIPDGPGQIHTTPQLRAVSPKGLSINLPETGRRIQGALRDIRVHFQQQGIAFKGSLASLEPDAITVQLSPLSAHYFEGITPMTNLSLTFLKEKTHLFETDARLIKQDVFGDSIMLHLKPAEAIPTPHDGQRFGKKAFKMVPTPDFQFIHPLVHTQQITTIDSLSAVGLECTLRGESLPLLPGMHLKTAAISMGDLYNLPMEARVTRCKTKLDKKGNKENHFTIHFETIDLETHRKIQSLVHKAEDRNIRLSTPVDPEDLWRFFFETGFIYKSKYRLFLNNKEKIKETYHALYSGPMELTRHMTYQDKGRTLGHMSILRYAERAWLIHHHAALKGGGVKVGLGVLSHMLHFFYDSFWHKAMGMDYLICYFRPENEFPNFFFNGFRQHIRNPKICSTDLFAYLYFQGEPTKVEILPPEWTLAPATIEDISIFSEHYEETSGGMLVDALDLFEHHAPAADLALRFQKAGLKKERHLWAIRYKKEHVALLIVNTSDVALNMSDLTNCIKVCITRPELLTEKILSITLNRLSEAFNNAKAPVLVHPLTWAEERKFHFQKRYYFWVFNSDYPEDYMQYFFDILKLTEPNAS